MMRRCVLVLAFLVWSSIAAASPEFPNSVTYRETTGKESEQFTWVLQPGSDICLTVTRPDERFLNTFDRTAETIRWSHIGPQRNITACRQDDRLILNGDLNGNAVQKEWTIGDSPWYQALSYCLRPFLKSTSRKIEFWMIRPDTVDAVKLCAEKAEVEPITVNGRCFEAWKVKIYRTGFLSIFWQGEYWYRVKDGLFLKYSGIHGPPGTPPTVVELVPD